MNVYIHNTNNCTSFHSYYFAHFPLYIHTHEYVQDFPYTRANMCKLGFCGICEGILKGWALVMRSQEIARPLDVL